MPKSSAREQRRHKRRFAPTLTNPGMRIIMRNLAVKDRSGTKPKKESPQ